LIIINSDLRINKIIEIIKSSFNSVSFILNAEYNAGDCTVEINESTMKLCYKVVKRSII